MYFTGELPAGRIPTIAIVGTRKPTSYGREVAHRLTYELAQKGVIVVSGLALGTDAVAHRGALAAGGTTLAVLANSVDTIYPRSHEALAKEIVASGGAILSEYEPPTGARAYQFLARNRIVSGLSDAVIVVEATARSGTLSTAAHALEQGKEVFAVPGNITSPLSAGCNTLLKQGAHPVTGTEDILEVIAPQYVTRQSILPLGTTPLETKIIELLQSGIRDGDQLQQLSGFDAREFSQAITIMEINGTLRALGANQWTIS
jgi:DNA processing protein